MGAPVIISLPTAIVILRPVQKKIQEEEARRRHYEESRDALKAKIFGLNSLELKVRPVRRRCTTTAAKTGRKNMPLSVQAGHVRGWGHVLSSSDGNEDHRFGTAVRGTCTPFRSQPVSDTFSAS